MFRRRHSLARVAVVGLGIALIPLAADAQTAPAVAVSNWLTSGNAGTNDTTNFVGTTDAVGLALRTDNKSRLVIGPNGNVFVAQNLVAQSGVTFPDGTDQVVGLPTPGPAGTYLRSDGTDWTQTVIKVGDLPAGSISYIHNGSTPQAGANFAIAGSGGIGSTLTVAGNAAIGVLSASASASDVRLAVQGGSNGDRTQGETGLDATGGPGGKAQSVGAGQGGTAGVLAGGDGGNAGKIAGPGGTGAIISGGKGGNGSAVGPGGVGALISGGSAGIGLVPSSGGDGLVVTAGNPAGTAISARADSGDILDGYTGGSDLSHQVFSVTREGQVTTSAGVRYADGTLQTSAAKHLVAGWVTANGTITLGSGFTIAHPRTGQYTVTFPSGSWPTGLPVFTAMPLGCILSDFGEGNSGSGVTVTLAFEGLNGAATDAPFTFQAVQS